MQDVRYALRQLRANPVFAAIVIASLALGIGANTAIFSLVNDVLLSRLAAGHPEQLVVLAWGGDQWPHDRPSSC
jgi:putative ABC transport system permease protein